MNIGGRSGRRPCLIPSLTDAALRIVGVTPITFFTRLSLAVYLVEAGLILTVAPWTEWWRRNYFLDLWPTLGPVIDTRAARWFVVAAGLMTTVAGMSDLRTTLLGRLALSVGR